MSNMVVGGLAGGSIGALGGYVTADPGQEAGSAIRGGLIGLGIGAGAGAAKFGIEKGIGALKGAYKNITNPPFKPKSTTYNGRNLSHDRGPEMNAAMDEWLNKTGFGFKKSNEPIESAMNVVNRVKTDRGKKIDSNTANWLQRTGFGFNRA
jgi:hypothetical protein